MTELSVLPLLVRYNIFNNALYFETAAALQFTAAEPPIAQDILHLVHGLRSPVVQHLTGRYDSAVQKTAP